MASPLWTSSALFLTYDEHGGLYDHVPPPPACAPDADRADAAAGRRRRRPSTASASACRSSSSRRSRASGYVSHTVHDHTSVLRFIEARFDLPALTNRDANADPLLDLFDFANPPFMTPPELPAATIDPDLPGCTG